MAAVGSECFSLGSIVSCTTCHNEEIEGEVLAFDPHTKMLVLKSPASNGRPSMCDISVVNLSLVSNLQVKSENSSAVTSPPLALNLDKLNTRIRNAIEEKKRLVNALNSSVSPEGQKLFLAISKTINEVSWEGDNIIVWGSVKITPPYMLDNLKGDPDNKALPHVRKIVEKHIKDTNYQATANNSASNISK